MERSNIIKITLMLFCALFFIELSNYSYLREYLLQESKIISYYISKECGLSNKVMNYGLLLILLIELIVFITPIGKLISITSIDISLILIVFLVNFMAIFIYELIKPLLTKWFKD